MNEPKCNDTAFGEMNYKHRWYKKQEVELFGKPWEVTIVAKAYTGKSITEEQQKSYILYFEKQKEYAETIAEVIKKYVNDNAQELADVWVNARTVENTDDIAHIVTPRTLLFKQDGTTVMLLDCLWDDECGIGVKIIPEVVIGSQDIFL